MKQHVFRYELLTQDIKLQGYPGGIPDCFKVYECIDGRTVFEDEESGLLVCYHLKDGQIYPGKFLFIVVGVRKWMCNKLKYSFKRIRGYSVDVFHSYYHIRLDHLLDRIHHSKNMGRTLRVSF